jgi:hypothetical protein
LVPYFVDEVVLKVKKVLDRDKEFKQCRKEEEVRKEQVIEEAFCVDDNEIEEVFSALNDY